MDGIFKDLATNLLADAIWMSLLIVVAGGWWLVLDMGPEARASMD